MTEKRKYALEWQNSAKYFYDNGSYSKLSKLIAKHKTILEIGCGTGHSTLSLLEQGHSVIAIDQNLFCIEKAKDLITAAGYLIKENADSLKFGEVCFFECDVTSDEFVEKILRSVHIDAVVCWNVCSYWDKEKLQDSIPKMLQYGLTIEQIRSNTESSYGELIIWCACTIAKLKKCAVHIVDRGTYNITKHNDPYYSSLKREFDFKKIKYDNIEATTISKGGRQLVTNGEVNTEEVLPIVFVSIIMQ